MGFQPGHPKYGGRAKGTGNKATSPVKQKAEELGIDPFEVLLYFAAGDWKSLGYKAETYTVHSKDYSNEFLSIEPSTRAKAASDACQYLYPKLKQIDQKHIDVKSLDIDDQIQEFQLGIQLLEEQKKQNGS